MTWETLTATEVLTEFNSDEKAQVDALSGDSGNLAAVTARVVEEFRQAIVDGGGEVESASTIPAGFKGHAIALARWRFLILLPKTDELQTEHRKQAAEKAEALIEAIATGQRKVAPPATPASEASGIASPSFGTRDGVDLRAREFTRTNQDG